MSNTRYSVILILLFVAATQFSCKKDSSGIKTKTELLTGKGWKLISYKFGYINTNLQEGFPDYLDCRKDDILSFNPNLIYILDEGNLKCNPSGSQIFRQGIWEFQENETKLLMVDTISRDLLEIKQLDQTQLKTIQKFTQGSDTSIVEATYVH